MTMNIESWAKAFRITVICLCVLAAGVALAYVTALFYLYSFDHDPKLWTNQISFYARPSQGSVGQNIVGEPSLLGALVVRGNSGNPTYASRYELSLGEIKPSALRDCLLVAEDKRFYRHAGLDYLGLSSALFAHFFGGRQLRGASTITNQLMGEVILADRSRKGLRGFWRKLEEIILTNVAEGHFSKDDLLLAYVNNVPIGQLNQTALIGFSAAGEAMFGKRDPKRLTLSEACTLAGMLNRPNRYLQDASKGDYRRIRERRDRVLENLGRAYPERYPEAVIHRAKREEIRFFRNKKMPATEARQLIGYAYQQLPTNKPGLRVYLTVDSNLQRAAENSVSEELARFDRGPYGFYNHLSYSHALKERRIVSEDETKLQAALVVLDAKTGDILAMAGGRNSTGEFNRATQTKRAPGSAIKPFIYLYGINSGSLNGRPFGPDTIIDAAKSPAAQRYTTGGAAIATVQLARSDNGAAVTLASEIGISRIKNFIAKVTGANPVESELIAIGAGKGIEISPLDLAAAYTIFPNNGIKVAPKAVWAVDDGEKKLEAKAVRVVDPSAALIVTRMLRSVIGDGQEGQYGTARNARKLSGLDSIIPLAGKTGTGDNDLWFVGFTPRMVVVVWVGFDNNYPPFEMEKGFEGAGLPLQIWARFMREVKKSRRDLLAAKFEMPSGLAKE